MNGRDGVVGGIGDQNGDTVRCTDRQGNTGLVGDQRVGLALNAGSAGEDRAIRMDLAEGSGRQVRPALGVAGTEAVDQTGDRGQSSGAKHAMGIQREH
jgi:hypothetical protein